MPTTRKMAPKLPTRTWTLTLKVTDSPEDGEGYLDDAEIRETVTHGDYLVGVEMEITRCEMASQAKIREI